jgi:hypothetical protein
MGEVTMSESIHIPAKQTSRRRWWLAILASLLAFWALVLFQMADGFR